MIAILRKPSIIALNFAISVALVFAFMAWTPSVGGVILDSLASVEDTSALLFSMSAAQKSSHFWMTLLLDYAFPVAYGAFFAGLALQFRGWVGIILAVPAALVFGADVVENTVQLLALQGFDGLLFAKAYLTPAKFFLFNVAALIAVLSLVWHGFGKIRSYAIRKRAD